MRRFFFPVLGFVVSLTALRAADYPVQPVPFTAVRVTGGFWQKRQETNRTVTLPFALQQCEESGRMKNFDLAAEVMRRRAAGEKDYQVTPPTIYPFDDTDAYKAIEGAAYVLSMRRDAALEEQIDAWIARIAAAQEPDGYLYTFRTMHPDTPGHKWVQPERWLGDPELSHELYNLGHLYEAGVAYHQATGKRALLEVCLRNAELLWQDFGTGKLKIAPGHQIIELALVRLYRVTGDPRHLQLAKIFLDAREGGGPTYNQRHRPVVEQDEAVGHSVRANYMYSGMADIAAMTGDARYLAAMQKIWQNVVAKKLYLTGGVGAIGKWEGYGENYELPHDGYNETCAALALMQWAHRMFLLTGDADYMNVFERTCFNGFLSGVSLSGDRFFYPNPLVYDGQAKNNHGHAGRAPWFGCACCPPNLMRTLAALTGYFYAVKSDALYVNFFAESEAEVTVAGTKVRLAQVTDYPRTGVVRLKVAPEKPVTFTVRVRIPGWAQGRPVPSDLYTYVAAAEPSWSASVAGEAVSGTLVRGYLEITREWRAGDVIELGLPMPVRRVLGHPQIAATKDRVAFERGPVVFCFEDVETKTSLDDARVSPDAVVTERWTSDLLDGIDVLDVPAKRGGQPVTLPAIPYYSWANRGNVPMAVWLQQEL